VSRQLSKFEKSLLETNFHHGYRLNFHDYKRKTSPLICSSFAPDHHPRCGVVESRQSYRETLLYSRYLPSSLPLLATTFFLQIRQMAATPLVGPSLTVSIAARALNRLATVPVTWPALPLGAPSFSEGERERGEPR